MANRSSSRLALAVGWLVLIPSVARAQVPPSPQPPAPLVRSPAGTPFAPEDKSRIVAAVLANPRVAATVSGHRLRALSVVREEPDKGDARAAAVVSLATVILFDYTAGYAIRARLNTSTAALVSEERLAGRPPASPEELVEAKRIIRASLDDARLLDAGGVLEGGFVVDPPKGGASIEPGQVAHRIIQFQILTPDRAQFERIVYVDLTTEKIIASESR